MSKIQAMFSARGRRMFASERADVDAFNAKYAGMSGNAVGVVTKPIAKPVPNRNLAIKKAIKKLAYDRYGMTVIGNAVAVPVGPQQSIGEPLPEQQDVTYRDAKSGEALTGRARDW